MDIDLLFVAFNVTNLASISLNEGPVFQDLAGES